MQSSLSCWDSSCQQLSKAFQNTLLSDICCYKRKTGEEVNKQQNETFVIRQNTEEWKVQANPNPSSFNFSDCQLRLTLDKIGCSKKEHFVGEEKNDDSVCFRSKICHLDIKFLTFKAGLTIHQITFIGNFNLIKSPFMILTVNSRKCPSNQILA